RVDQARPSGAPDAAGLRQAVCQARQDRRCRCGSGCEAVARPTMRFVPVKSPEQQAALSMHRTRDLLVKQRTQLVNMIRGLLAEFGVDIPKGLERALLMARRIVDGEAPHT